MTTFARSFTPPPRPLLLAARGLIVLSALLAALLLASPASAHVTVVEGSTVGLQSPNSAELLDGTLRVNEAGEVEENAQPESFANASGHPVVHASNIYAIYWDPTRDNYHGDWQGVINGFLAAVGADSGGLANVFSVDAQYTDKSNVPAAYRTTFRGSATDTHAYPASGCTDPRPLEKVEAHKIGPLACLTDGQLRQELQSYIAGHNLPKGMGTVYYLLTPPGVAVCLDGGGAGGHCSDFTASSTEEKEGKIKTASYKRSFCSYHSDVNPDNVETGDANTVLYGVIPWTAGGLADGQLALADERGASFCQDGGFNPASTPIEQQEGPVQQEPNQVSCPSTDGYCDAGLADLIVNQLAIEQQNIITNPLLNAWQDSAGNEATDECRNFFAPVLGGSSGVVPGSKAGSLYNQTIAGHSYFLNVAFNRAALLLNYPSVNCIPALRLEPKFTAPNTVNAGDVVGFNGMESAISLNAATSFPAGAPKTTYATYSWNFGDGTPVLTGFAPGAPPCESPWLTPCAGSVFHSYQYGGEYEVTLTVADVAGNIASTSHRVSVTGPSAPQKGPAGSPGGSPGTSGSPTTTTTTTTAGTSTPTSTPPPPLVIPVAAAAAASHSLKATLRKGLVVRYSVSEQVAGRFEVLLSKALAGRLGIGGPPALGLPPGTAAQVVIAKAILVTTKAGRSTIDIQFSKRTAARLKRLHKVSLLLRLIVHNSASRPATATVLTTVVLSG